MSEQESPAAVLKRAAQLIRERAEAMPPSPWQAVGRDVLAVQEHDGEPDWDFSSNVAVCRRQDEAEYIATLHPGVALALADLLASAALDAGEAHQHGRRWCFSACDEPGAVEEALKIARAILGEETR